MGRIATIRPEKPRLTVCLVAEAARATIRAASPIIVAAVAAASAAAGAALALARAAVAVVVAEVALVATIAFAATADPGAATVVALALGGGASTNAFAVVPVAPTAALERAALVVAPAAVAIDFAVPLQIDVGILRQAKFGLGQRDNRARRPGELHRRRAPVDLRYQRTGPVIKTAVVHASLLARCVAPNCQPLGTSLSCGTALHESLFLSTRTYSMMVILMNVQPRCE